MNVVHDKFARATNLLNSSTMSARCVHSAVGSGLQSVNDQLHDLLDKIYTNWEQTWQGHPSMMASQKTQGLNALKKTSEALGYVIQIYVYQQHSGRLALLPAFVDKEEPVEESPQTAEAPPPPAQAACKDEPVDEDFPDVSNVDAAAEVKLEEEEFPEWTGEIPGDPQPCTSTRDRELRDELDRMVRASMRRIHNPESAKVPPHIDLRNFSFKYPCVICMGVNSTQCSPTDPVHREHFFQALIESYPKRAEVLRIVAADPRKSVNACWEHYPYIGSEEQEARKKCAAAASSAASSSNTAAAAAAEIRDQPPSQYVPAVPVEPAQKVPCDLVQTSKIKVRMANCALCRCARPSFVMSPRQPEKVDRFYDSIKAKPCEIQLIEELRMSGKQQHICEAHFKSAQPLKRARLEPTQVEMRREPTRPQSPMWQYCDM